VPLPDIPGPRPVGRRERARDHPLTEDGEAELLRLATTDEETSADDAGHALDVLTAPAEP